MATIVYNGNEIPISEGQTITLKCAEKVFATDVVVRNVSEEITFTIDGTSYTALEGMTWAEWCESEYNTIGLWVGDDVVFVSSTMAGQKIIRLPNGADVRPFDYVGNYAYIVSSNN